MKATPKCPNCNKSLIKVLENDYKTYVFEPGSGSYKLDEVAGYIETHCPYCYADLGDIFEEGACNYTAEEKLPPATNIKHGSSRVITRKQDD